MGMQCESHGFETSSVGAVPFVDAEEAWFWFIQAQAARHDGAKIVAGQATCLRPCDPVDIFKVVDRLYRNRRLNMDHMRVLKHYGQRLMSPEKERPTEMRSYTLWHEALDMIGDVLVAKGIVQRPVIEVFHDDAYMCEGTIQ